MASRTLCGLKTDPKKDRLAIRLGTDIMNLLIQVFRKLEHVYV